MMQVEPTSALVLFSGGQDSTTCLAWALERYRHVETIGFDYAQRHSIELSVREPIRQALCQTSPAWRARLGPDHLISLDTLSAVAESSLLNDAPFGTREDGLPSTFVPGRNIVFITYAGIIAKQRDIKALVTGTCETDFSGYPDCRDDTIKAMQIALNLGLEARIVIHTPLMWIDKASTWALAEAIGGAPLLDLIVEETHTCYRGDRTQRHAWGYGCSECDACALRARGWDNYRSSGIQAARTP
jgi:7-cyano-7-deazaguanine synthase